MYYVSGKVIKKTHIRNATCSYCDIEGVTLVTLERGETWECDACGINGELFSFYKRPMPYFLLHRKKIVYGALLPAWSLVDSNLNPPEEFVQIDRFIELGGAKPNHTHIWYRAEEVEPLILIKLCGECDEVGNVGHEKDYLCIYCRDGIERLDRA